MKHIFYDTPRGLAALALAAVALLSGGCAGPTVSSSAATIKITEAGSAIEAAQHDCLQSAPDLKAAQYKLEQARLSLSAQDYRAAVWMAEEAAADAQYARTRAAQEQAEQYREMLRQCNEKLKSGLGDAAGR